MDSEGADGARGPELISDHVRRTNEAGLINKNTINHVPEPPESFDEPNMVKVLLVLFVSHSRRTGVTE